MSYLVNELTVTFGVAALYGVTAAAVVAGVDTIRNPVTLYNDRCE
ncbi:MAG: hypothetical protein OXR66_03840 [Candidatus Woesearchaeota archaeon]|nr:hypothetical protein [Candidatus Woesearchaeota archaeon]